MATRSAATQPAGRAKPVETQELPDYCARPSCRRAFTRVIGPGRPQAFCSEICRRSAEKELRQAKSRLAHFETLVEQMRIDVAAFGRTNGDADPDEVSLESRRTAQDAVHRVSGVLAFLENSNDPVARELTALHSAVAPVILGSSSY